MLYAGSFTPQAQAVLELLVAVRLLGLEAVHVFEEKDDRLKLEWVVAGKTGDTVTLTARHERAGVVRASVVLA